MEQAQTIVCPNCGAVTASNQNCEYCGSMLTKVASVLCKEADDIKASLKDLGFGKSAYVSSGLLKAVDRTIAQCNKYHTITESYQSIMPKRLAFFNEIKMRSNEAEEERFISSILKAQKDDNSALLGIMINDPLSMSIISFDPNKQPMLVIKCYMLWDISNKWYTNFERQRISKLFVKEQVGDFMVIGTILDKDTKAAAQFIKYILKVFFGKTDADCTFDTFVQIDKDIYEISTEKKKEVDNIIEKEEKEYINKVKNEQSTCIWDIQRESIFPSFKTIFYLVVILASGVYIGELYSLTTALIILGSMIVLSTIINGVSKSRRINEVKDLETFKTKFCRIKRPDVSSYPKFLEE